jgi:hypothetical protein
MYDGSGRLVGTLLEPEIFPGDQTWSIDPGNITGLQLPDGIYYICLVIEGKSHTVRIVKAEE